jgi:chaperonin GroES
MQQSVRPLADRVLVRPDNPEKKTASGIIIPDTVKEKQVTGEVVGVGPMVTEELKPGDRVLYSKFAGMAVPYNGEEVVVMREADIFAVI